MTYDAIFLSYDEEDADDLYKSMKERFPHLKRVHGVKGIFSAHKKCAMISNTKMFYVIDADSELLPNVSLTLKPDNEEVVYIWRCKNPVNGLTYGYGGLKLFPKKAFYIDKKIIDVTTTVSKAGIQVINEVASITHFNTTPFHAWRSAFRECTKLSSKVIQNQNDDETEHRLDVWCTVGENELNGKYVINGANLGRAYGLTNKGNPDALAMINDYDWLRDQYNRYN